MHNVAMHEPFEYIGEQKGVRVIAGEVAPIFDDLAQAYVLAFDGVSGVDNFFGPLPGRRKTR